MPASDRSSRRGRRPRAARVLIGVVALLAGLLLAAYALFPWLAAGAASRLAAAAGIEQLDLAVARPGLRMLPVASLRLTSGRLQLSARDGRVAYGPGDLLGGTVQSVHFEQVSVRIARAGDTEAASGAVPPSLDAAFAAIPAQRVTVERLTLEVPAVAFRAAGSFVLDGPQLDLRLRGLAPAEAERFLADARVRADGQVRVVVAEQAAEAAPLITVESVLRGRALRLDGELDLHGFALDLAAALAGLPAGEGRLSGNFQAQLPWPLPEPVDAASLAAEGALAGRWLPATEPWAVPGVTADWRFEQGALHAEAAGTVRLQQRTFRARASVNGMDLALGTGSGRLGVGLVEDEAAALELDWQLEPEHLAVSGSYALGPPSFRFVADQAGLPDGAGELSGSIETRLPWPLPTAWQDLRPPSRGTLRGGWQPAQHDLRLADLNGAWALAADGLSGSLQGRVHYHGLALDAALELDRLQLEGAAVTARATAKLGQAVRLPVELSHRLDDAVGKAAFGGEITVNGPLADALVEGWNEPWDVTGGRIDLQGDLAWSPSEAVTGEVRARLEDVAARYRDYRLAGLTGRLHLRAEGDAGWALEPSPLRVSLLDTGVEVRDLETGLGWRDNALTVQPTAAGLLGGRLRVDTFAYRTDTGQADFVVDLMDLELSQILALEGEHVSGTGRLDGTLPVRLRGHAPSVVAGDVRADPPGGVLRVSSALAGGTGQPGLDFALRALQDFRYSLLQADVDYAADGELTLAVHLQGRNPEIEAGRPIHYNVTVNENLPTLLKSLRLQDELTRQIERRVTD